MGEKISVNREDVTHWLRCLGYYVDHHHHPESDYDALRAIREMHNSLSTTSANEVA